MIDATGGGWNTAKSLISIIHSLHTASWSMAGVRADWRLPGSTPDSTQHDLEKSRIGPSSCSFLDDELLISVPALVASVGVFHPSSGVKLLVVTLLFCTCNSSPPTASNNMSRSIAPSRALLKAFQETQVPSRQCPRFLSSSQASFTRRPTPTSGPDQSSRHQPLVQKRFKYKSVEEARSRYQIGVGKQTERKVDFYA